MSTMSGPLVSATPATPHRHQCPSMRQSSSVTVFPSCLCLVQQLHTSSTRLKLSVLTFLAVTIIEVGSLLHGLFKDTAASSSVERVHGDTQPVVRHAVPVVFQLEISEGTVGVEKGDNVLVVRIICFLLVVLVGGGAQNILYGSKVDGTTITTNSVAVSGEVVSDVGSNT